MGTLLMGLCLTCAGWCAPTDANPGFVTDVLVGHNNRGPYNLSWTDIDLKSVVVVVSGRALRNRDDFNVDAAKGVIGFNSVVATDAIVRVSYNTIPGKSKRAVGNLNIPIALDIFQRPDTSIKLMGMYAQDDPNNPEAGKSVFGFGGDKKWAASKMSSMLLLSQRNATDDGGQGSVWDRAAMKFGGDTKVGAFTFAGSYFHSGTDFAGGKEYGVGVGKDAMDFTAAFDPNSALHATAKFQRSEDTAGNTKGNYSSVNEQGLAYSPGALTKLSFTHSTTETRTAVAGSEKNVDSTLFRLDQGFGGKTSAALAFGTQTIEAGGQTDHVTTRSLNLTSAPMRRISFRTAMAQRDSELYGEEQTFAFGVTATPIDTVSVDVGVGTLANQTVGEQTSTNVRVTASPVKQVALQATVATTDSSKLGGTVKTNISVQATPAKNVQMQGTLIGDTVNDQDRYQRDFSLSSTPTRYSKLTAMLSQKGANEWDDVSKSALLELTPFQRCQFATGYRYIESGTNLMTIWDYSATAKPWEAFSFTGSIRDRDVENADALDSSSFQLALSPRNYFSLTGDYQENPEDKKGMIQPFRSKTVGLSTKIGSVGVRTDFTQKDEYQCSRISDERGVGLETPMFGHGFLSTGVRMARILDGSELANLTYSLGYRHAVGSDFSLSFTGYYTRRLRDRVYVPGEDEYKAEGSVGLKF